MPLTETLLRATAPLHSFPPDCGGILIHGPTREDVETAKERFLLQLEELKLHRFVHTTHEVKAGCHSIRFQLDAWIANEWAADCDTTQLCTQLQLDTNNNANDLAREILLAMLLGPVAFEFPSHEELQSAVRIRQNIVTAGRSTAMAFDTVVAERPTEYWTYSEENGFTVLPGKPLITALQKATQPGASGRLYSFSCYRATEYVILLGIAQELTTSNPTLFHQLQRQWEQQAIMSGRFHETFLREYGSMAAPLPPKYYVPGDRLWFRNPDAHSSDVMGYEGSWVFYLGNGLFSNFWKPDQPYTLTAKCLELFHWRHATYRDPSGELQIDESIVEARVRESMNDPDEVERILAEMLRLREPQGIYVDGGCIDTSREYPRWVCPHTADLQLPGI
ncbi:hypothetical protein [Sulfuriferula sp. AH1]|uniref:hypothetical protein n=1 Tax=Sulfuriferula sp. AH1 TaxID=1985873 RepID=UPI001CB9332B|nr:hypothetical protein [Sulfuriferula sp. AH1]